MTTTESTTATRRLDVPAADACLMPGCDREQLRAGYCGRHYDDRPTTCAASNCDRKATRRGYCDAHYQQLYVRGQPAPTRVAERKHRRTPEELAKLDQLMHRLDVEAEHGIWLGLAEQLIALLVETGQAANIPQPARVRWKRGTVQAGAADALDQAHGYLLQLGAILEHPVLLVAAVRALQDELTATCSTPVTRP
jgi:hypothetical protein